MAQAAGPPGTTVSAALGMRAFTRDSVGPLGGRADSATSQGGSRCGRLVHGEVLLTDDVVTTGATADESVRVLQTAGAWVAGHPGHRARLTTEASTGAAITAIVSQK